jgi:hypothetical protein
MPETRALLPDTARVAARNSMDGAIGSIAEGFSTEIGEPIAFGT